MSPLELNSHSGAPSTAVVSHQASNEGAGIQVRCTILDAWGWCTGTTQRDGMGREEGGGFTGVGCHALLQGIFLTQD